MLLEQFILLCVDPTNIPPLESISLNTPLICSNAYSMKKQMGDSAIYFNPKNYKSISKKIKLVLNNNKLRKNLIKNGKKKYQNIT